MTNQTGTEKEWYVINVLDRRGGQLDTVRLKAESEQDARRRFDEYEGYEISVEHENGGNNWEVVFAKSEEEARETAFEREIPYVGVLDVLEPDMKSILEVQRESEVYA